MKLGNFELDTIYTGDARALAEEMPDESVDLVLTDPPFGLDFKYNNGFDDNPESYPELVRWIISESNRVIKPGGLCFVFVAQPQLRHILPLFPDDSRIFAACKNFVQYRPTPVQYSYDPVIFWKKEGHSLVSPMAGRRDYHIGNTAYYVTLDTFHSCPRPLNTITYMVDNFAPEGGVVLDLFMGSGTTAIASKITGRHFLGFELDPATADKARQRVHNTQPPLFVTAPTQSALL